MVQMRLLCSVLLVLTAISALASAHIPSKHRKPSVACAQKTDARVRFLAVGGGMGGRNAMYEYARVGAGSAQHPGQSGATGILLVDERSEIHRCGIIDDITYPESSGLGATPFVPNTPYHPFRMGTCALRYNIATMPGMRVLAAELQLPSYCTPWATETHADNQTLNRESFARNSRFNCPPTAVVDDAFSCPGGPGESVPCNPTFGCDNNGNSDLVLQINATNGVFNLPTYAGPERNPAAYDPNEEFIGWAAGYPEFVNPTFNYTGDGTTFGGASADAYDPEDPTQDHPLHRCEEHENLFSMFVRYLGENYAHFICYENVGFFGDCFTNINACFWLDWTYREYNTADDCYPVGGMSEFCTRMERRVITNAFGTNVKANFAQNERVTGIARADPSKHAQRYHVTTTLRNIYADELLLAIPPDAYANMTGDIAAELRQQPEMQWPKPVATVTVTLHWDQPAGQQWYNEILAPLWSSVRRIDPNSTTNRLELLRTPYHSLSSPMSAIRGVYTDFFWIDYWLERAHADFPFGLPENQQVTYPLNGQVATAIMQELRRVLTPPGCSPDLCATAIPRPDHVYLRYQPRAWYWGQPQFVPQLSWRDVYEWAQQPLGPTEKIGLGHQAFMGYYSGWAMSSVNMTRSSLMKIAPDRFPAALYDNLRTGFGKFEDDNTVGPGYEVDALVEQGLYENLFPNEHAPPYAFGEPIDWGAAPLPPF